MVNNLVFRWPKSLFFYGFGGSWYMYIYIYISTLGICGNEICMYRKHHKYSPLPPMATLPPNIFSGVCWLNITFICEYIFYYMLTPHPSKHGDWETT